MRRIGDLPYERGIYREDSGVYNPPPGTAGQPLPPPQSRAPDGFVNPLHFTTIIISRYFAPERAVVPANFRRDFLSVQNNDPVESLYVNFGNPVNSDQGQAGILLVPGAALFLDMKVPHDSIYIFPLNSGAPTVPAILVEGTRVQPALLPRMY